jgi:hypothetical protein
MEYFLSALHFQQGEGFGILNQDRPFPVNLIPELNARKSWMPVFISIKRDSSAT